MFPWMPISNRPSTTFYKQEMQFFFAKLSPRKSLPKDTTRLKQPLQLKVQHDILVFKTRLERARKARSKYASF
jgi:hypothetical protein